MTLVVYQDSSTVPCRHLFNVVSSSSRFKSCLEWLTHFVRSGDSDHHVMTYTVYHIPKSYSTLLAHFGWISLHRNFIL